MSMKNSNDTIGQCLNQLRHSLSGTPGEKFTVTDVSTGTLFSYIKWSFKLPVA
jgi:hypothetical protein